jgi:hypothetical protein
MWQLNLLRGSATARISERDYIYHICERLKVGTMRPPSKRPDLIMVIARGLQSHGESGRKRISTLTIAPVLWALLDWPRRCPASEVLDAARICKLYPGRTSDWCGGTAPPSRGRRNNRFRDPRLGLMCSTHHYNLVRRITFCTRSAD